MQMDGIRLSFENNGHRVAGCPGAKSDQGARQDCNCCSTLADLGQTVQEVKQESKDEEQKAERRHHTQKAVRVVVVQEARERGDEPEYVKAMCVAASFLGSILLSNCMNPSGLWHNNDPSKLHNPLVNGWASCCAVGFVCAFLAVIFSAVRIAGGPNGTSFFFVAANIFFVLSVLLAFAAMMVFGFTMYGETFIGSMVICSLAALLVTVATLCSLPRHCPRCWPCGQQQELPAALEVRQERQQKGRHAEALTAAVQQKAKDLWLGICDVAALAVAKLKSMVVSE